MQQSTRVENKLSNYFTHIIITTNYAIVRHCYLVSATSHYPLFITLCRHEYSAVAHPFIFASKICCEQQLKRIIM